MAIIALKAWYIQDYEPITEVVKRKQDLRLSKNSLLKSGLRADFLDESEKVQESAWFKAYLEGKTIEFYIEGSGGYVISNIDLISQEIYFSKQELIANLDPIIFFSYQTEDPVASEIIATGLEEAIALINKRSRLPIGIEKAPRPGENPLRLSDSQLRKIRKSLLLVADITPIVKINQEDGYALIPNPNVCVEIGYALQTKKYHQMLLLNMERSDLTGQFPFDIPHHQQLGFKTRSQLEENLPIVLETLLQRFNLLS